MQPSQEETPTPKEEECQGAAKDENEVAKEKNRKIDRRDHPERLTPGREGGEREVGVADQAVVSRASMSAKASPSGIMGPKLRSKWETTPSTPAASRLKRRRMQRTRNGLKL